MRRRFLAPVRVTLGAAAMLGVASPALAGPPYYTDDPVPAEQGHWEIYGYAAGATWRGAREGDAGFDINYGAARDLQLTAVVPMSWESEHGTRAGRGDLELGAKYRFVHQSEHGFRPDISFFPSVTLPTGTARLGGGRTSLLLPVWVQKDWGKWSLFGGGGYAINRGHDRRNSWVSGVALARDVSEKLQLGAELYRETSDERGERATRGASLGATYELGRHLALLGSAGPQWQGGRSGSHFYLALEFHR